LGGEGTTNASKKEGGRREDEAAKEVGWGDAERVREADGRVENSEVGGGMCESRFNVQSSDSLTCAGLEHGNP